MPNFTSEIQAELWLIVAWQVLSVAEGRANERDVCIHDSMDVSICLPAEMVPIKALARLWFFKPQTEKQGQGRAVSFDDVAKRNAAVLNNLHREAAGSNSSIASATELLQCVQHAHRSVSD
jgi:hypothetical protein